MNKRSLFCFSLIAAFFLASPFRVAAQDTTSRGSYWKQAEPAGSETAGTQEAASKSEEKTEAGSSGLVGDTKEAFLDPNEQWSDQKVRDADRVGYADWETQRGYVKGNSYGSDRYHRVAKKRLAAWKAKRDKADQEKGNGS